MQCQVSLTKMLIKAWKAITITNFNTPLLQFKLKKYSVKMLLTLKHLLLPILKTLESWQIMLAEKNLT